MKRLFFLFIALVLSVSPAIGFNFKLLDDYTGPPCDFRDEFNGTLAAGSVDGTLSTSGHLRCVTDSASHLSFAGGALVLDGGASSYGDPRISWIASGTCAGPTGFSRVAGKIFITDLTVTDVTSALEFGWDTDLAGALAGSSVRIVSDTYLPYDGGTARGSVATPADGTNYKAAVILRAAGAYHLLKTTTGNWKLLWADPTNNTATVYPTVSGNTAALTSASGCQPSMCWLPQPLLSTRFGS